MPMEKYKGGCEAALAAVDSMPPEYRALVYEFDLREVWKFWKAGWPAAQAKRELR